MTQAYDVVINGAGMVGAVTALMCAEQGLCVAVVESQSQTNYNYKQARESRVSAISKDNLAVFERLGISQLMHQERVGYYDQMQVWDNHSTGEIVFNSDDSQVLGAMIENNHIIAAAQQLLINNPQIDVMFETIINEFEDIGRKVQLNLSNQTTINTSLLIGADGARSQTRQALGIEIQQKPYNQKGLVCYLNFSNAPVKTALQAFNAGGPVGLLPMNEGDFSMVWSLPDEQVDHWLSVDEAQFINGLKAHINRDLGEVKLCSERAAFPLYQNYAASYYQGRVALIGDAAHTIHPLAGQGVNLGFADGACLVEKLTGSSQSASQNTLKNSDELAQALKKFQRKRKAEVHKTSETMHALHHLFSNQSAAAKILRATGMNRLNQLKPIKQWLLKQAGS